MSKTTTAYNCTITFTETEVEALARGELPPEVQAAAIGLLRQANSTPAQTVERHRQPIPASKACHVCGVRWAQPNTGGKCVGCVRRSGVLQDGTMPERMR